MTSFSSSLAALLLVPAWLSLATSTVASAALQDFDSGSDLGARFYVTSREMDIGDLNGNGHPDFVIDGGIGFDRGVFYLAGDGTGAFADPVFIGAPGQSTESLEVVDLDGDGLLDVLTSSLNAGNVAWIRNLGGGQFASPAVIWAQSGQAREASAADLDGDGDLDLVVGASWSGRRFATIENLGGGSWAPPVAIPQTSGINAAKFFILRDWDGDGDVDIFAEQGFFGGAKRTVVTLNRGDGTFPPVTVIDTSYTYLPWAFTTSDVDGDGDDDICSYDTTGRVRWRENLGGGAFASARVLFRDGSFGGLGAADFDGDGDDDFVYQNGSGLILAENLGALNFAPPRVIGPVASSFASLFVGDLDTDGDPDVVSAVSPGTVQWYRNTPELAVSATAPVPDLVSPSVTTVRVTIEELVPGSVDLGASFVAASSGALADEFPLVPLGGDQYEVALSGFPCGASIDWQVVARSTLASEYRSETYCVWLVDSATQTVGFDMEVDSGWTASPPGDTATAGRWTRANPRGTEGQPEDDFGADGTRCWFTGQGPIGGGLGDADVDGGFTTLVTAPIDVSTTPNPHVSYRRWFYGLRSDDGWTTEVSADGVTWVVVDDLVADLSTLGGWERHVVRLADFVSTAGTIQLRFRVSDLGEPSPVEGALDNLEIVSIDCGGIGTDFCSPAVPNISGQPAVLTALGSSHALDNNLTLRTEGLAVDQFGYYVVGGTQAPNPGAGGSAGTICVQAPLGRFASQVMSSGAMGTITVPIDLTALPTLPAQAVLAGDVWHFQLWYRDATSTGAATSNFSNGVTVVFD